MQIGYCSNVHPGRTLAEVQQQLASTGLAVKESVSPNEPMPIGLWLSETTSRELAQQDSSQQFSEWLANVGLIPFTLNGFPFGDFHQAVVKHQVYEPNWADPARLDYTIRLAHIHNQLLPAGLSGTISTLPLGWPSDQSPDEEEDFYRACADNLISCANALARLENESGRKIVLCLEPEPGCWIDVSTDVVHFFQNYLLPMAGSESDTVLRHIGVCHDICHAAVMFEDQSTALRNYTTAGIQIGKIQVSSALSVDFDAIEDPQRAREQLAAYAEPRYLHQTSVQVDGEIIYYEDLSMALHAEGETPSGQWRVHFHVPIFVQHDRLLQTTQSDIGQCFRALDDLGQSIDHIEIETYAWNVLPESLQTESLASGIAREIDWFREQMQHRFS